MKLKPVTKFDQRNTVTLKKLAINSCPQIVTSLFFFNLCTIHNYPDVGFWKHGL